MRLSKKALVVSAAFSIMASGLVATAQPVCGTKGCWAKISEVLTWQNGKIELYVEADTTNLLCGQNENATFYPAQSKRILFDRSNLGRDTLYAQVLSAEAQDRTVFVRIIDNSSPCEVNYIRLRDSVQ